MQTYLLGVFPSVVEKLVQNLCTHIRQRVAHGRFNNSKLTKRSKKTVRALPNREATTRAASCIDQPCVSEAKPGDARTGDPGRVHQDMARVQRSREDGQKVRGVARDRIDKEEGREPLAPGAQILDCARRRSVPVPRCQTKATHLSAEPALRLRAKVSSQSFQTG